MTSPAQRKGKRYELDVADAYQTAGAGTLRRTPNSGGLAIKCDLRGIEGLAIECKHQERLNIWACLDQAQHQASPGEIPVLHFRRNRGASYVAIPQPDWLGLLVEVHELRSLRGSDG